jgi:hypothetical protein
MTTPDQTPTPSRASSKPPAGPATAGTVPNTGTIAPRPARIGVPWGPILLLLILIGALAAGVILLLRPHVEFTNGLAGRVHLVVGDGAPQTVPPAGVVRVALRRGRTLVVQWELVRPLSADSTPMGEEVRGSTVVREPSGTVAVRASSRTQDAAYFAPLITNASSRPLRVMVNAGLQGAVDCGCAVRPGGRRVFIGYYRLFQNSTVQARAEGGGSATFKDLGTEVSAADGSVGLRFEDRDLR